MKKPFDLKATCTLDDILDIAVIEHKAGESYKADGNDGMAENKEMNEILIMQMIIALFDVSAKDLFAEFDKRINRRD